MRMLSARGLGLFCGVVIGLSAAMADAATVSLRAVKRNGAAITPTNNLVIAPNDLIEAEIFLSGWGSELPNGVRTVQMALAGLVGVQSGDNGTVLPEGWVAPLDVIPCSVNADCLDARYPVCTGAETGCRATTHNPDLGAFVTSSRTDYLFNGLGNIFGVDTNILNYRYFALATDDVTVDTGVARYVGTLIVRATANACGVFTFGFQNDFTFITNFDQSITIFPVPQPLVLTVGSCALQLLDCDPDHCVTDSRQPHDLDNTSARQTINTFVATFSGSSANIAAANFVISQVPNNGPLPGFQSITNSGNSSTIVLNRRLNTNVYTCFRHILSNKQCCFGVLPGDADGSLRTQPTDTFELIDNLDGLVLPRLIAEKCDLDRSALCTPADILREVDMLTGANAFVIYNDSSLPACPSMVIR